MVRITKKRFLAKLDGTRGNKTMLAQRLSVTRKTIYNFLEKNPELEIEIEQEMDKRQDMAEAKLDINIMNGDMKAIDMALTKHKRGRMRGYGEEVTINTTEARESFAEALKKEDELWNTLTPEQKQKFIEAL